MSAYAEARAAIAARRAVIEAGTPGPWDVWEDMQAETFVVQHGRTFMGIVAKMGYARPDAALIVVAVNALAKDTDLIEAVLERHKPLPPNPQYQNVWCSYLNHLLWPCPDARAALTALGVEVQ